MSEKDRELPVRVDDRDIPIAAEPTAEHRRYEEHALDNAIDKAVREGQYDGGRAKTELLEFINRRYVRRR